MQLSGQRPWIVQWFCVTGLFGVRDVSLRGGGWGGEGGRKGWEGASGKVEDVPGDRCPKIGLGALVHREIQHSMCQRILEDFVVEQLKGRLEL